MPRFNPSGTAYASGVGGGGHILSINGVQMFREPSSAVGWINDHEVMSGTWTNWQDIRTIAVDRNGPFNNERVLFHGPSDGAACGGGRWAVKPAREPWLLDDGSRSELALEHFGSLDGCEVTWAWAGGGLVIGGTVVEANAHCSGVQVFDRHTGLWQQSGTVKTLGIPVPTWLPGRAQNLRAALHEGRWWAVYQSTWNGRLVCHPFDSLIGYVLTEPFDTHNPETWAYRPDIVSVGGRLAVVWAVIESELPDQVRFVPDVLALRAVDLLTTGEPVPVPEPDMPATIPNQKATVERIRAKYPSGPMPKPTQAAFLIELAQAIGEIPGAGKAGLHLKGGSNAYPVPGGKTVDGDLILFEDGHMFDVLGAEETQSTPIWHDEGFSDKPIAEIYYRVPTGGPVPPEPEPPSTTHLYIGGGNDTGTCDECGLSRFDPIHAIPESKRTHAYDPGEDGQGLCDICQQPADALIHHGVVPPPDEPPDQPPDQPPTQPGDDVLAELRAFRAKFDRIFK